MFSASPSRRRLLQLAGAAAAMPAGTATAGAQVTGRVIAVADLHSAYERTARLLSVFEQEARSGSAPLVIAINGDIFERGNVVAFRSGGAIDWAFLAEASRIAPTVVNLGNHENAVTADLAEVVSRLRALGVHVVSNIVDRRTGAGFAEPAVDVPFGLGLLRVVGIATDALNTYPAASREQLLIPSPGKWAKARLPDLLARTGANLVLSHAGLTSDRDMLPGLPDGTLMIGGHDHLLFQHSQGRTTYAHTGSWANACTIAEFHSDGSVTTNSRPVGMDTPLTSPIAGLITSTLAAHLTEDEQRILGTRGRALSLGDTGRRVAYGLAEATGAWAGVIGHTTMGTGAPSGPVTRYVLDSIVRFDGKLMVAEVPRGQAEAFLARANQDRPIAFADRSGDFLYGAARTPNGESRVQIVTTDWCATHQSQYFGTTGLAFREAPDLTVKEVAFSALLKAEVVTPLPDHSF